MLFRFINFTTMLVCILLSSLSATANINGYYRYPALNDNTLIFTSEGDLWSVAATGGDAHRLTRHQGNEHQAAISPDGKWVAFVASYDAEPEVYVMPVMGGMPKRLSFESNRVAVRGWTANGEVIYATGSRSTRMVHLVNPETLDSSKIPLAHANQLTYDEAGKFVYFTRFGLEQTGDHAKQYKGGSVAQLWRYKLGSSKEAVRYLEGLNADLTTPMWWQQRIYFVSNKDGTANIWSVDEAGKNLTQHTKNAAWDIRDARMDNGRISYQMGADIYIYNIEQDKSELVPIRLLSDQDVSRERWVKNPLKYHTSSIFGANGEAVAITARGKVILATTGKKRRVELNIPQQNRSRAAVPGAKGEFVYLINDISGENEIWRYPVDGSGQGEQLTTGGAVHRWRLYPSPDGKYLAHDNKRGELWLLNLQTKQNYRIYNDRNGNDDIYGDISWSADGNLLAFTYGGGHQQINQVVLHSIKEKKSLELTTEKYQASSPAFSPDGKWLYFFSERNFQATPGHPWGDRNTGTMFNKRSKAYAYALQPENRFPFLSDDELMKDNNDKNTEQDEDKKEATQLPAVEWKGLMDRLYELPLTAGNYDHLSVDSKRLYFLSHSIEANSQPSLVTFPIEADSAKLETILTAVADYSLSADGKKMFYRTAEKGETGSMYIVEAGNKVSVKDQDKVRLNDWSLSIIPRDEWRQMFNDAWRMHRDFSFDPKMRGLDWEAVRTKYLPLVDRVSHRLELSDLLGEMTGELGILHSQVRGGDLPTDDEKAITASLGAELQKVSKGFKINYIYKTDPDFPSLKGPLAKPGIDVMKGDVITAVNGRKVSNIEDLVYAMNNKTGQQLLLDIVRKGSAKHQVVVLPISGRSNSNLRYLDWIESNKAKVEAASNDKIGYFHLRAMGAGDLANFTREFYANYLKDGLIIDVRGNGGGNVDSLIIEKLLRQTWSFWKFGDKDSYGNMQQTFRGHIVVLIDQATYSDGETFAAGIKALGIAPLIGKRTAGAGIWLSGRNPLSDKGIARIAEFAQYRMDGKWMLEGWGVAPDEEVENPPLATFNGEDKQLEVAIERLQEMIRDKPVPKLKAKPISPVGTPAVDIK